MTRTRTSDGDVPDALMATCYGQRAGTGLADQIAFGRPYIGNPDLAERLRHGWPLTEADRFTYFTRRGEAGYTDFPEFQRWCSGTLIRPSCEGGVTFASSGASSGLTCGMRAGPIVTWAQKVDTLFIHVA